jgi:hypothetical protein
VQSRVEAAEGRLRMNACGKQGDQVKSTGGVGKESRDGGRRREGG